MYDFSTTREFARLDGEIKRLRTLMADVADELAHLGLGEIVDRLRAGRLPGAPRVPSFGQPTTLWTSPTADTTCATVAPRGAL